MAEASRQLSLGYKGFWYEAPVVAGALSFVPSAADQEQSMRYSIVVIAALLTMVIGSNTFAQTCLRPKWTECVSFPNGGRHTGISPYGKPVEIEVLAGPDICVSTEWEIEAETYALFQRGGMPWPNRDWEVRVETFCFYRN
jgi:hypothetical protein